MDEATQTTTTAIREAFRDHREPGTVLRKPDEVIIDPGNRRDWEDQGQVIMEEAPGVAVAATAAVVTGGKAPALTLVGRAIVGVATYYVTNSATKALKAALKDTNADEAPEAETHKKKKKK